jgi:uncharacterized OB-fold protein
MTLPKHFQPFFDSIAKDSLAFPFCNACGAFQWYPMPSCKSCNGSDIVWRRIEGKARLYSWTVVRYRMGRTNTQEIPYVVGLVEFPDAPGVRLITNLIDIDPAELREGLDVSPRFIRGKPPKVVFGRAAPKA